MSGHTPWAAVKLRRVVSGALRSTINDHGPVGANGVASAAKRVVGQLKDSYGVWLDEQIAETAAEIEQPTVFYTDPFLDGRLAALRQVRGYLFGG